MKKVEKKPVAEEPKQEKVQLKKSKVTEKPKVEKPAGVQLKPTPARERKEEEKKEPVKLKRVPQQKKDNEAEQRVSEDFRGVGLQEPQEDEREEPGAKTGENKMEQQTSQNDMVVQSEDEKTLKDTTHKSKESFDVEQKDIHENQNESSKRTEPVKKLSHSISREEEKQLPKQTENPRKVIVSTNSKQREMLETPKLSLEMVEGGENLSKSKIKLNKPKVIEENKKDRSTELRVQLKTTPAKKKKEEEKKDDVKLKPLQQIKKENNNKQKDSEDFRGVGLQNVDGVETQKRVKLVKNTQKKVKTESKIESVQFDELIDDENADQTEPNYFVEEPNESISKSRVADHAQRVIEVIETSEDDGNEIQLWPQGIKEDLKTPLIEPKPKDELPKIDIRLKNVKPVEKEIVSEKIQNVVLRPTPKEEKKEKESKEIESFSQDKLRTRQPKQRTNKEDEVFF